MRYSNELTAISDWCQRYRIPCADIDTAMHRFDAYLKLLLHYQKRTNLIGCESVSQIVEDLFIDSLQILRTGDLGATCVDVGSGAGFPAIPLQIMASPAAFHLVEPRTKRYAFLQCVCRELGFSTVIVHNAKIENCDLASVDFAISKAFAPILDWLETARRWTECGAQVACLVAQRDWEAARQVVEKDYVVVGEIDVSQRVYVRLEKRCRV